MTDTLFQRHSKDKVDYFLAQKLWTSETLFGLLKKVALTTPNNIFAIESSGLTYTFKDLMLTSTYFSNSLLELGFRKGDVLAVQLPSCIEFLIAYFGAARIGCILSPMHMPYEVQELEPLLAFTGAKGIICVAEDKSWNRPQGLKKLKNQMSSLKHLIVARGKIEDDKCLNMLDLYTPNSKLQEPERILAEDATLLCFTSGTSASPKAVIHASETLISDARAYANTIDLTECDRALIIPPFTHVFGLECVHNALCVGGSIIILDTFSPGAFADTLETKKPTIVYGAPAHLAATLRDGALSNKSLKSVKHVIVGGSICSPAVAKEFENQLPNGRVGILFGMTETLLVTQTAYDATPKERHGTVGKPIPGVEVRILDNCGVVLKPGIEGKLELKGFTVMSGYVKNKKENSKSFSQDGWFNTGDLAMWDEHGNIIITGRSTDVINRGGVKINPSDIEAVVAEHPDVIQVALIPMPDEILGERICAVLQTKNNKAITLEDLSNFLSEKNIPKRRRPEAVFLVKEMPVTPTKKIIKKKLTEQFF
tara:strand:+ start:1701 stop:3317 length:1617 start_codon:yes stop_codon:yes gene_type:complete